MYPGWPTHLFIKLHFQRQTLKHCQSLPWC